MSEAYRAVNWSSQKKKIDLSVGMFVLAYLVVFVGVTLLLFPGATAETLVLRATGSLGFVMLTCVLLIGPLARLNRKFLPVLYNRRHLGVATFFVGLIHGSLATFQFHALGDINPLVSLLVSDGSFSQSDLPFTPLGLAVLAVLFLMAATSHDFWLANLSPKVWKALHMLAYPAYALLLGHVALGALQGERQEYLWPMLAAGATAVFGLHIVAGFRERLRDLEAPSLAHLGEANAQEKLGKDAEGWVPTVIAREIVEGRAKVATVGDERVAVFRNENTISCVSNVCCHQMGPLGEGKIVDGYITCPWHGFQYDPVDGRAPEPFSDRLPTFDVRIQNGLVWVRTEPNPLGMKAQTAQVKAGGGDPAETKR